VSFPDIWRCEGGVFMWFKKRQPVSDKQIAGLVMTSEEMIRIIEHHLQRMGDYSRWKMGITDNPAACFKRLGEPTFWCCWEGASGEIAHQAIAYFMAKHVAVDHLELGVGGRFVYLF